MLYKQYGLDVFKHLIKSILLRFGLVYETLYVFEKNLILKDVNNRLERYDTALVRDLNLSDFDMCSELQDSKKQLFKERLELGTYKVFGIIFNNELVYYSWISLSKMGLPFGFDNEIALNENEALLEDSYCNPSYRGRGYHSMVNIIRLKAILDSGKNKAIVFVLKDNIPAIKVQIKSGFELSKKIKLTKTFGKQKIKYINLND